MKLTHLISLSLTLVFMTNPYCVNAQEYPEMEAAIPKSERHGSLSPDNQKIVFSTGQGFDRDLAIVDMPSREIVPLTLNAHEDSHPRWSPDGNWIVFQREDTLGNRDLYIIRSDGSEERNITKTPNHREQHPAYSPDGSLIIFDSNRDEKDLMSDDQNYEIYSMEVSSGAVTRLTTWDHWDMYPSFSPDNSHIAWRRAIAKDEQDDQNFEIFVKNLNTGKEWNISTDPAYDSNPHWSPTGDLIAFASARSGSFNVFLVKPDGTDLRRITQAEGRSIGFSIPTISFDGKKIVADRYVKGVVDMVIVDMTDLEKE